MDNQWPATNWQARCYNDRNMEVLRLEPRSLESGLHALGYEIRLIGNPERIVRCDLYDLKGFVCRMNVRS
jgi:hypothetical protein